MKANEGDLSRSAERCANCGEVLRGPFCAACGQSEKDIRLPILTLATEAADGLFSWDGRLLATLRALYLTPGQVAREYCDGKRASYTAPIRLYLLISLAFFAAMGLAGVRVVAVTLQPTDAEILAQDPERIAERRAALAGIEDVDATERGALLCGVDPGPDELAPDGAFYFARDTNLIVTLFQHGEPPSPRRMTPEMAQCLVRDVEAAGMSKRFAEIARLALSEPAAFERRASAAAGQALILMVGAFMLLNMALHPRRRVIEHLIHALYFHAAFLPLLAAALMAGALLKGDSAVQIAIAAIATIFILVLIWSSDRGFYRSSWWGALLRMIPLYIGYVLAAGLTSIGLLFLPTF